MRKLLIGIWVLFFAVPAGAQEGAYTLNPGDLLDISVWKEDNMQRQVLVLPDGTISFPLAGHIVVAGKTPEEVQAILTERISGYIPDPVITVSVPNVAGYKIYVTGQVNRPGEFAATHRVDVMQAISLAGGLTPFGDEDDIKVLRRENGQQVAFPFDYGAVENGENLEMNILLQSGDTVVVPD